MRGERGLSLWPSSLNFEGQKKTHVWRAEWVLSMAPSGGEERRANSSGKPVLEGLPAVVRLLTGLSPYFFTGTDTSRSLLYSVRNTQAVRGRSPIHFAIFIRARIRRNREVRSSLIRVGRLAGSKSTGMRWSNGLCHPPIWFLCRSHSSVSTSAPARP